MHILGGEIEYEHKDDNNCIETITCDVRNYNGSTLTINSMLTATIKEIDAHKPAQIKCPHEAHMLKDLAIMYDDGQLLDCTIAVPKANREFKVGF